MDVKRRLNASSWITFMVLYYYVRNKRVLHDSKGGIFHRIEGTIVKHVAMNAIGIFQNCSVYCGKHWSQQLHCFAIAFNGNGFLLKIKINDEKEFQTQCLRQYSVRWSTNTGKINAIQNCTYLNLRTLSCPYLWRKPKFDKNNAGWQRKFFFCCWPMDWAATTWLRIVMLSWPANSVAKNTTDASFESDVYTGIKTSYH